MIENDKFGQELLAKIKEDQVAPKAKWKFRLKNYLLWSVGAAALVMAGVAVSLVLYMIRSNDWDVYGRMGRGPMEVLFVAVPFFWILCLGIFTLIAYFDIKRTKKGYRYPALWIVVAAAVSSSLLGIIFYFSGVGERIDNSLSRQAPFYDQIINPNIRFWSNPEEGRLSGVVISRSDDQVYLLIDMARQEWTVFTDGMRTEGAVLVEIGKPARFLGKVTDEHEFKAEEILPMRMGKGFFERMGPMPMMTTKLKMHGPDNIMKCQGRADGLSGLFSKYPELKEAFVSDLLERKEMIGKMAEKDPDIYNEIVNLGIPPQVIEELQK